jgi:mRNA interferase RelE/StbE
MKIPNFEMTTNRIYHYGRNSMHQIHKRRYRAQALCTRRLGYVRGKSTDEYKVVFSKSAEKDLQKVSSVYLVSIESHIKKLSENPRPPGSIKLTGSKNFYRIRVGIYRII